MIAPAINSYGLWEVIPPFIVPNIKLKCTSIVLISKLLSQGVDVYGLYYEPKGVAISVYNQDLANSVSMATLEGGTNTLVIPTSYISKIPADVIEPYSRRIISFDLGELPDSLDLSSVISDAITLLVDRTGVMSIPTKTHLVKSSINRTIAESLSLEAVRLNNINSNISFTAELADAQNTISLLRARILELEQSVIQLMS